MKPFTSVDTIRGHSTIDVNKIGSCPDLVKQGRLKVLLRFPVRRRGGKTALFLGGSFSIALVEVPMFSTSPNVAKSLKPFKSVDTIRGHTIYG
jgi:hypothetical protein